MFSKSWPVFHHEAYRDFSCTFTQDISCIAQYYHCWIQWLEQGILKGEVSMYSWPPVWLVWNQLYDYCNFCFYLQNRLLQTNQTGGQRYSDTSPFSIPWLEYTRHLFGIISLKDLRFVFNLTFTFAGKTNLRRTWEELNIRSDLCSHSPRI